MRDTVQFLWAYIIVAYPDFADVYAHFVLCVYLGVGWGGVEVFPTPPNKEKKAMEVYALRFVRTASYATGKQYSSMRTKENDRILWILEYYISLCNTVSHIHRHRNS